MPWLRHGGWLAPRFGVVDPSGLEPRPLPGARTEARTRPQAPPDRMLRRNGDRTERWPRAGMRTSRRPPSATRGGWRAGDTTPGVAARRVARARAATPLTPSGSPNPPVDRPGPPATAMWVGSPRAPGDRRAPTAPVASGIEGQPRASRVAPPRGSGPRSTSRRGSRRGLPRAYVRCVCDPVVGRSRVRSPGIRRGPHRRRKPASRERAVRHRSTRLARAGPSSCP